MATADPHTVSDPVQFNRRWRPALMSFFLRRVRSHEEAEDLTQEVFARLLKSGEPSGSAPDSYVFQMAANLLRDGARRTKVRTEYRSMIGALEDAGVELLDPARIAGARDTLADVASGLDALPERTRTIFTLYRIENLDMQTIAESFGISKSAVKKHVMKAMAALMARTREPV